MSFVWFIVKIYVFDIVYSGVLAFTLLPLMLQALAVAPKPAQGPAVGTGKDDKKNIPMFAVTLVLLFLLCAAQGAIVAGAVKMSLASRPDAWSIVWYIIAFGAAVPTVITATRRKTEEAEIGRLVGMVSAGVGYVTVCIWPAVLPQWLQNVATVLAV